MFEDKGQTKVSDINTSRHCSRFVLLKEIVNYKIFRTSDWFDVFTSVAPPSEFYDLDLKLVTEKPYS